MHDSEYLDLYEQRLTQQLLRLTTDAGILKGQLLETPDLEERWKDIAAAYLVDAVPEIAQYPNVALGWMVYVGMALARQWDEDWARYSAQADLYAPLREARGFDCLDEYVREEILGFERDGSDFRQAEDLVRQLSQTALDLIRHEAIEPQSPMAFHVFVRSIHALFLIGISIELQRLGYKWERREE